MKDNRHVQKVIYHGQKHKYKLLVLLVVAIIGGVAALRSNGDPQSAEASLKVVEVIQVSDISHEGSQLPLVGVLEANEQLDLHAQISGQVAAVHVKLDQEVYAGQRLIELKHRDLDAAVAQAAASVQTAQATLEKLENGARPEDQLILQQNVTQAETSLEDARINLENTLAQNQINLMSALENAIQTIKSAKLSADQILNLDLQTIFNSDGKLIPVISDIDLLNQSNRLFTETENDLLAWDQEINGISQNNQREVEAALQSARNHLLKFSNFLQVVGNTLQETVAVPAYTATQIIAAKSTVNLAQASIKTQQDVIILQQQGIDNLELTQKQAIDAAQSQIDQAHTNLKSSKQQLLIGQRGARPEDLKLQQAVVAQAQATLALAAANRDKAIVRAPITGKIIYLPVEVGGLLMSSSIAVSLANNEGLEVETFVTEKERALISIGNTVLINDDFSAEVREIAPALDPVNKKIQVLITVTDESAADHLTLGETVRLRVQKNDAEMAILKVPLSTVRLKPSGAEVMIVNSNNELEIIQVEIGEVTGSKIEILTPLDEGLQLIKDSRGLKAGQLVEIKV